MDMQVYTRDGLNDIGTSHSDRTQCFASPRGLLKHKKCVQSEFMGWTSGIKYMLSGVSSVLHVDLSKTLVSNHK